jgi:hypothetical protein
VRLARVLPALIVLAMLPAALPHGAVPHEHIADSPAADHPAGWHAPTTHEHGDAPPQWVLRSPVKPFTQTRESHVGYKGVYAKDGGGRGSRAT